MTPRRAACPSRHALVDVHQLGYSSFEVEFCRMIREGKADLTHWRNVFELLEYTSRTGMFVRPPVEQGLAVARGAAVLRVHDVAETVDVVRMIEAVESAE